MSVCRQVLPDVLSVRESGLRSADAAQDAQLETSILLLPLVRHTFMSSNTHSAGVTLLLSVDVISCRPQDVVVSRHDDLSGSHVHIVMVLRYRRHGDRRNDLQIHRVPRVRRHGNQNPVLS